jgi:hypothetical protein
MQPARVRDFCRAVVSAVRLPEEMLGDRRLWVIALIICTCFGLIADSRLVTAKAPVFDDREASLREIAAQHLGSKEGLDQLREVLSSLPPNGRVIFFGSSADWGSTETYLLTSYLAWPHGVWFIHKGGPLQVPAAPAPPESPDMQNTLFFFGVTPPPPFVAKATMIGPRLSIVRNPEVSP